MTLRLALIAAAGLAALASLTTVAAGQAARTDITAADLMRESKFGDPLRNDWNSEELEGSHAETGLFSPDHAHVAVVVRSGDPAAQANTARLIVYSTATLMQTGGDPIEVANLASTGLGQPIAFVEWLSDNETLVFSGSQGDALAQVYRVNIRHPTIEAISRVTDPLSYYSITPDGRRLLTMTTPPDVTQLEDSTCRRYGCRLTARAHWDVDHGGYRFTPGFVTDVATGQATKLPDVSSNPSLGSCDDEFPGGISPDGRFALRNCRVTVAALPAWWSTYTMNSNFAECGQVHNVRCWRYTVLFDLQTGEASRWTDAPQLPQFWMSDPIWIDGGKHLIIPGGFATLTGASPEERAKRIKAYEVQLLDPVTKQVTRIGTLDERAGAIGKATWDETTETLVVTGKVGYDHELPPRAFQRKHGEWVALPAAPRRSEARAVHSVVDQSINARPVLFAVDDKTGKRRQLLDPNAWLDQRKIGKVETIHWRTKEGRALYGGLYYPPDYKPGMRYPLMLQTHGFDSTTFSLAGEAKNFGAAALAARSIIVLQVAENDDDVEYVKKFWQASRESYEAAIDHLDSLGLIDRQHVGIVGWSHTGDTMAALLVHSEYPIAAGMFTDTGVNGWWYSMYAGGGIGNSLRFNDPAYGPGLATWLELSPTFNLARVQAPMLIWQAEGVDATWDWYSGLNSLKKPVEFWSLPTGTHDIYQASQRLHMNQLFVDWFVFWLKGEERSGADVADQYARWHELRAMHEADLKTPRPPLYTWQATAR